MQATSDLWTSLWRAGARAEYRVTIAGTDYGEEHIVSHVVSTAFASGTTLEVGACVSAQLELELWGVDEIPRNAQIISRVRLTDGEDSSEWLPYGIYFVDTRETVPNSGTTRLTCYDSMLKAEQVFWTGDGGADTWPRTMSAVVSTICTRMGVALDERTQLKDYMVAYPNDLTIREILGYIAAAHGGCWTISPAGKLRLITLAELPEETCYLVDEWGDAITFGGDRIIV